MSTKHILLTLLSVASLQNAVAAETTGSIGGRVFDAQNLQPLIGANVSVQGTSRGAATDKDGYFLAKRLEPGSYKLRIRYVGYRTILKSNVIVNPLRKTVLQIEMPPDILQSEEITVTASYFEKPAEAVVSTHTMDFEEIRRSPGATLDIQRVMQAPRMAGVLQIRGVVNLL